MIDRIVIKNFKIPRGASTTCSRNDTLRQEDDMAFTVEDFHDLVQLLEDRPQWRAEMRRLVMGDEYLAVPEQIAELQRQTAELQRQTADLQLQTAELRRETAELGRKLERLRLDMERRFGHVQVQLDQLTTDVGQLTTDVGQLKGENLERRYRERAHAYFGRLISKGRVVGSEQLSDLLEEAVHGGVLTQRDRDEVGWADLVMRGRWIADGRQVMVLAEISSLVDLNDVRRAVDRAALLATLGTPVVPVVAGESVTERAADMARSHNVWQMLNGRIIEPPADASRG